MFNKYDLLSTLRLLDKKLSKRDIIIELTIVGGGALVLQNLRTGSTRDLDTVSKIDRESKKAIEEVSVELNIPKDWLNSNSSVFAPIGSLELEDFKEDFGFTNIKLSVPVRIDLLRLKIKAELDRGFDYRDILSLSPTKRELMKIKKEVSLMSFWNQFEIDSLFQNLERDIEK